MARLLTEMNRLDRSTAGSSDLRPAWLFRLPLFRRVRLELERLQKQLTASKAKLLALRAKLQDERAAFRQRNLWARQRRLTEVVLEQSLAVRHNALRTSSRREAALAREADFLTRSASYRELLARGEERLKDRPAEQVRIGTLTWWIPADARVPGNLTDRLARERWLPLREILQTRELAVGTIMLDIGANIGTTAIPRVILGDFQYIYAAEPSPANYACLVHTIVANGLQGFVLPDQVAISSHDGAAHLLQTEQIGTHRLLRALDSASPGAAVRVPCRTLDSWVNAMGIDLDSVAFIKCDTQGWEPYVLMGAPEVLKKKHIAWEVEFSPGLLASAGHTPLDVYELLEQHFSHFIDLKGDGSGIRVRHTSELRTALQYVEARRRRYTNLLLHNAQEH